MSCPPWDFAAFHRAISAGADAAFAVRERLVAILVTVGEEAGARLAIAALRQALPAGAAG